MMAALFHVRVTAALQNECCDKDREHCGGLYARIMAARVGGVVILTTEQAMELYDEADYQANYTDAESPVAGYKNTWRGVLRQLDAQEVAR